MNKNSFRILSLVVCMILLAPLASPSYLSFQQSPHYSTAATSSTTYEMTQYHLPNGSSWPFAITTDSLGKIWIVEQESNQLGMFDPYTSTFREYSIPTPNSTPNAVAVDSFGNVWVTELASNKLAELKNGSSTMIEYNIPSGSIALVDRVEQLACGPVGVFVGPKENIWIFCDFSNQIVEFFPKNSTFDSFDLPVWQSGPVDLVFDRNGNFWFTAADANMLGKVVVSELRNGTNSGITEFAPLNDTYIFTFDHPTDLNGDTNTINSSLPTPSGIGLSPDGKTLWITEHIDGSFDSYNIETKSLDRYWTSKTYGNFGYPYSFPNGLEVDSAGTVWIAEHYGNKVAEFNPAAGKMIEYEVPCCGAISSGLYTLTLGKNGTVWFVEIFGNAIGELRPVPSSQSFEINTQKAFTVSGNLPESITIPVDVFYSGFAAGQQTKVSLDIASTSKTGALVGASAQFSPQTFEISDSGNVSSNLVLSVRSLKPGIYDFTVSANLSDSNTTYSTIFGLSVPAAPPNYGTLLVYAVITGVIGSAAVVAILSLRTRRRRVRTRRNRRSV